MHRRGSTRRIDRLRWLAGGAIALAISCRSDGGLGFCEYCGAVGLLASEYAAEEREKEDRLERCGTCPPGQRCNILVDPAGCRPDPGIEGDPCGKWRDRDEHSFDCADGLVCNPATKPPTCMVPGGPGTPCHNNEHCAASAYCDDDVSVLQCAPVLAKGTPCTYDDQCRPLACRGEPRPVCSPRGKAGEQCKSALQCEDDLTCPSDTQVCTVFDPPT